MKKKYLVGSACLLAALAIPVAATAASAAPLAPASGPGLNLGFKLLNPPIDFTWGANSFGHLHFQVQVVIWADGAAPQVVAGTEYCTPSGAANPASWCGWNYLYPGSDDLVVGFDDAVCVPGGSVSVLGSGGGVSPTCDSGGMRFLITPAGQVTVDSFN